MSLKPENSVLHIEKVRSEDNAEFLFLYSISNNDTSLSAYLKVPTNSNKFPSIVVLGGMQTGKEAVNYAYGVDNVAIAAPDYRYKPKAKYDIYTILTDITDAYNATFLQIVDNILLIEFLKSWEKTKENKLSILGYSFGVPFAIVTANHIATDNMALVYGGADIKYLITQNLNIYNSFIDVFFSNIFWLHVMNFEPSKNLKNLNPLPILVINGKDDEKIPNYSAELLQNSIQFEKTLIWLKSKHVHPANKKLSMQIIEHLKQWYYKINFFEINHLD